MKILNTTTARRLAGKVVAEPDLTRVLVPIVTPKMVDGRAVLQITDTVVAEPGAAVGKYLGPAGFVSAAAEATNIRGQAGPESTTPGPQGNAGWTPVLAGEADGTRTLIKVADWTGGSGSKPSTGMYLGTAGYVATRAEAFNFNAAKRVFSLAAISNAQGIATFAFNVTPAFAVTPAVVVTSVVPNVLAGATRAAEVPNTRTKTGVQVRVEQMNIVGAAVGLLSGATINILVIES